MLTRMFRNFRNRGLRTQPTLMSVILNNSTFALPLTHTAIPTRGSITPTFTRATTETGQKWDEAGYLDFTALAGEMVFKGARRGRNWIQAPTENWASAGWAKSGISVSGNRLTATGANGVIYDNAALGMGTDRTAVGSVTLSRVTGTGNIDVSTNGGTTWTTVSVTGARVSVSLTGNINGQFAIRIVTSGDAVDATYPQLEDVTGQTTQIASEYVSVGVASAPAYHGSMVDGVKCFDTDLEYYPTNLLTKSQELSDAVTWNTSNASVTANQTTAPDGTSTADLYTAVVNAQQTVWYAPSITTAAVFAYSLHIKAGTASWINLNLWDGAGSPGGIQGWFNVATGAVGSLTASAGFTAYSSDSEALGDGWFRISLIGRTTGTIYPAFRVTDSDGSNASTATSGKTVYLWGAQLEQGDTATPYIATTTAAVTSSTTVGGDAISTSGSYPIVGYVPWEARTNLCLQSQTLGTTWAADASTSVTADQYVAPDGTTTMDKVTSLAVTSQHYLKQGITFSAGVTTYSFYFRYVNNQWCALVMSNGGGLLAASFDLLNGVVGALGAGTTSTIQATAIADVYRVSITGTMSAGAGYLFISPNSTDTASLQNYTAAGTETVGAWGAQVELGSFATPYIPTTTVAVARNADLLTYTGADVALLKTLMAGFRREVGVSSPSTVVALSDGTTNEYAQSFLSNATQSGMSGADGGAGEWSQLTSNAYAPGTASTMAWSAATNDVKMAKDGVAQTADTSATMPTVTQLSVGHIADLHQLNGNVGPIYGWTRNLSQSELNVITT